MFPTFFSNFNLSIFNLFGYDLFNTLHTNIYIYIYYLLINCMKLYISRTHVNLFVEDSFSLILRKPYVAAVVCHNPYINYIYIYIDIYS